MLAQHRQDVALVLARVPSPVEVVTTALPPNASVMSGRDRVESELGGPFQEPGELEMAVALDAGIGRASRRMDRHVRVDHMGVEIVDEVEDMVADPQLPRHPASVLHVSDGAASRVARATPQLHRGAHDVVTRPAQQRGGHRGVHASRHGNQDPHG